MSIEQTLREAEAERARAWQGLRDEVSSLRQDLTDRPIPQRLRERAIDKMVDAIDGAGTVVRDNAPALGTTLALLAGWSLRRPLLRAAGWLWERRPFAKR